MKSFVGDNKYQTAHVKEGAGEVQGCWLESQTPSSVISHSSITLSSNNSFCLFYPSFTRLEIFLGFCFVLV